MYSAILDIRKVFAFAVGMQREAKVTNADLRPCPFCAHRRPTLVVSGKDNVEIITIRCPECGASGPITTRQDPPGHAAFLWNQRYGTGVEH